MGGEYHNSQMYENTTNHIKKWCNVWNYIKPIITDSDQVL